MALTLFNRLHILTVGKAFVQFDLSRVKIFSYTKSAILILTLENTAQVKWSEKDSVLNSRKRLYFMLFLFK